MKKLMIILVMMLVASGVNAQGNKQDFIYKVYAPTEHDGLIDVTEQYYDKELHKGIYMFKYIYDGKQTFVKKVLKVDQKEQKEEDLFEWIENIEEKKRAKEEERIKKKEEEKILLEQTEKCKIFATKLRFQGVDVTKLTDEDIDRLDSLRQRHHIKNSYDRMFPHKSLYGLPSIVFKDAMKQERKYYARIYKKDATRHVRTLHNDTIYCAADSIVFVEPGIYHYITVRDLGESFESLREASWPLFREGSELRIGRATFICRDKENNNAKKRKEAKKADDMYYSKH